MIVSSLIEHLHQKYVQARRVRVLTSHLAELLPHGGPMLDVGCGDGSITERLAGMRPDLDITGLDVLVRPQTRIPVVPFDGVRIPFPDRSFPTVMLVDVLHHTDDPLVLLKESARVASRAVLLKDCTCDGWFANATLRFMDDVGNARHGVHLPYSFWAYERWLQAIDEVGLSIGEWRNRLGIYPLPASLLFDRTLHFAARLDVR